MLDGRDSFAKLWAGLLRGYTIDAVLEKPKDTTALSRQDVEQWVQAVAQSAATPHEVSGVGDYYAIRSPQVAGSVVLHAGKAVQRGRWAEWAESLKSADSALRPSETALQILTKLAHVLYPRFMAGKLATMNISLPAALRQRLEEKLDRHAYSSASEYVRDLIRKDLQREAIEKIDALLLQGINSGPATPMTAEDWTELRRVASRRVSKRSHARTQGRPASRRQKGSR